MLILPTRRHSNRKNHGSLADRQEHHRDHKKHVLERNRMDGAVVNGGYFAGSGPNGNVDSECNKRKRGK
ncbi:hypothetical protein NECAME_04784 [Necator americanus]|uniref:Uncharacterized protein n=1 Tax=Necator americanus TaxID=51031 RepID=W2SN35_NECAM|nr:hypothetical protein NECAME_04784 [Necator americanus]ETN70933.1 hypothetical protein NECAME_04784 [Necator americanus]